MDQGGDRRRAKSRIITRGIAFYFPKRSRVIRVFCMREGRQEKSPEAATPSISPLSSFTGNARLLSSATYIITVVYTLFAITRRVAESARSPFHFSLHNAIPNSRGWMREKERERERWRFACSILSRVSLISETCHFSRIRRKSRRATWTDSEVRRDPNGVREFAVSHEIPYL